MKGVDAITCPKMRDHVERLLREKGEIYGDIWKVGVNLALRISDLLSLTYEQVAGDHLVLKEGKTSKWREMPINSGAREVIERRRKANPDHIYLFQSDSNRSKALCQPINRSTVARVFKEVGERKSVGLRLGTHTLRKTRGAHLHNAEESIDKIALVLNHSSSATTRAYIGLTQRDVNDTYTNHVL